MAQGIGGDHKDKGTPEIKVVDRRSFTSEGKRREEEPAAPAERPAAPAAGGQAGPVESRPGAEKVPEAGKTVQGPGFTMKGDPAGGHDLADRDAAFINLSISIFESGCIHLGMNREEKGGGESGKLDLEAARGAIAMLEMLKRKTAGNLSDEEAKILDSLLSDLQMAYVMKAPGASS